MKTYREHKAEAASPLIQCVRQLVGKTGEPLPDMFHNGKPQDVAICAIGKLENLYIEEWVRHYIDLGVSRIYLYDNNDRGTENFASVLSKYADKVSITECYGKRAYQTDAYTDCYRKHGG